MRNRGKTFGSSLPENIKIGIGILCIITIVICTIIAMIGFSPKYGQFLRLLG